MCSGSGIMAARAKLEDFMILAVIKSDRNALNTNNSNPRPNPLHTHSYTSINHNMINY